MSRILWGVASNTARKFRESIPGFGGSPPPTAPLASFFAPASPIRIKYDNYAKFYHLRETLLAGTRKKALKLLTFMVIMAKSGTRRVSKFHASGVTIPETLVAVVLLATFFASIFELNAICLRYIDATKESVAALQHVQDRAEILRNLSFTDLTTTAAVQTVMATAPNAAPFAAKATETVKISAFPTANGITQFTRMPNGTVTTDSVATDLGKELVKVEVQVAWAMTLGGRSRTEQTTNILSNGTKK